MQRAGRAMHLIADAADVEDDEVLPVAVDNAFELPDHFACILSATLWRWCACVTAIASASAASSDCGSAFGSSTPIIMRICAFSQWPAPTIVFFTRFGAYSATVRPAIAGTSMATPRACPSLRVATASLFTKVASTAASSGACSSTTFRSPSWMATSRVASSALSSVASEPQAKKLRRLPSIATTPQPVRRRPGSMPRMRIGRLIWFLDSPEPPARLAHVPAKWTPVRRQEHAQLKTFEHDPFLRNGSCSNAEHTSPGIGRRKTGEAAKEPSPSGY